MNVKTIDNAEIINWCNRAGIMKHITFHSARHTHAVLLLENNADILQYRNA